MRAGISYNDTSTGTYLLVLVGRSRKWGIPKGGEQDSNETPMDCALREFREETGVQLVIGDNCILTGTKYYSNTVIFNMAGDASDIMGQIYIDPEKQTNGEILKIKFFTIAEMSKLLLNFPTHLHFHIRVSQQNKSIATHDGFVVITKDKRYILAFESVDRFYTLPITPHSNSYPANVNSLLSSVGLDDLIPLVPSSKRVNSSNVLYTVIRIPPGQMNSLSESMHFDNSKSFVGFKWAKFTEDELYRLSMNRNWLKLVD